MQRSIVNRWARVRRYGVRLAQQPSRRHARGGWTRVAMLVAARTHSAGRDRLIEHSRRCALAWEQRVMRVAGPMLWFRDLHWHARAQSPREALLDRSRVCNRGEGGKRVSATYFAYRDSTSGERNRRRPTSARRGAIQATAPRRIVRLAACGWPDGGVTSSAGRCPRTRCWTGWSGSSALRHRTRRRGS